jgi:hypothetical protein
VKQTLDLLAREIGDLGNIFIESHGNLQNSENV